MKIINKPKFKYGKGLFIISVVFAVVVFSLTPGYTLTPYSLIQVFALTLLFESSMLMLKSVQW